MLKLYDTHGLKIKECLKIYWHILWTKVNESKAALIILMCKAELTLYYTCIGALIKNLRGCYHAVIDYNWKNDKILNV